MVCKRGQVHVIVHVQPDYLLGKSLWRIFFPLVFKLFRLRTEISIQNSIKSPFPSRTQPFVIVLHHGLHVSFQHGINLPEHVIRLPVVQPLKHLKRHNPVFFCHIGNIRRSSPYRKIQHPVQADIFFSLVRISMLHEIHRCQIHRILPRSHHLRLQERGRCPRPASPRTILILHGSGGQSFNIREFISFRLYRVLLRIGHHRTREKKGTQNTYCFSHLFIFNDFIVCYKSIKRSVKYSRLPVKNKKGIKPQEVPL